MKSVCVVFCVIVLFKLTAGFCPAGFAGPSCNRYNFAYLKGTSQKEDWTSHSSHLAVDGNSSSCSLITPPVDNPWWQVDLGKNMTVQGMDLFLGQESLGIIDLYSVEVQPDGSSSWTMCKTYTGIPVTSPIYAICQQSVVGRHVRFTAYNDSLNLRLCDVGVYGTCLDGSYGNYCENTCTNCKNGAVCDRYTGRCPQGCDTGWSGTTCSETCPPQTYGDQCSRTCGKCQYNVTCNRFDGSCPNEGVCEPGYQSPMCQQLCPNGQWGFGCMNCGACKYKQPCDKINGTCLNGCDAGYKPAFVSSLDPVNYNPFCNITCDSGRYGMDCVYECGFCKGNSTVPETCNIITGKCDRGCAPGYVNDSSSPPSTQCRRECDNGKWGDNCQNVCGKCAIQQDNGTLTSAPCVKSDGLCPFGCLPSYQGVKCEDRCSPGFYGTGCKKCGNCLNQEPCDLLSGVCPGDCENGYLGNACNQVCPSGTYGFKCRGVCPVNCKTVCLPTDGSCICKDGWTGPFCRDVCPDNHYGKDCKFVCGNCKPGTTCDQGTGECPQGCADEWTGLKCDAKKIIEKFERSYGDVIGGTIGGAIALGLIIALIVWIVWRYRKDKSIHIRALASSIRQSFRRGRDSFRRSVQRLSMRARRNQDQQRLRNDIEGPAQSNGTRGERKHIPRMYECVKIHSNLIHYDDFPRIYVQLQEATHDGRTLLYESFQSFLAQRPRGNAPVQNGHTDDGRAYYNVAAEDVQTEVNSNKVPNIPQFLPLGANLSGFLLINAPAASELLWNHLQQRQIETIISIGKEASFVWQPGERITIGQDVVECMDVQLHTSHKETKLTVQRLNSRTRRSVRHLECYIWKKNELPLIPTLLMFIERFQQINYAHKERIILVNYLTQHEQALLFTLVASALEILADSKRADILRTVAIGGNATTKSVRKFDEFKYLHDVIFQYITSMENRHSSTAI